MGNATVIDSVIIYWTGPKKQKLTNVPVNQTLLAEFNNAAPEPINNGNATPPIFKDVTNELNIHYRHREQDYIDFDQEKLIPHKLSQSGPGLAVSDINGDGLDDLFIGAAAGNLGQFFLQQKNGTFTTMDLPAPIGHDARRPENMGILFFDADGDGDEDLYCASGSNEFPANTKNYQDQLYINDGSGHFRYDSTTSIPVNYSSKSCVKAADFDNDGDLDLFLAGRCLPGKYPYSVSSYIYRNDSKNGVIHFTDVTKEIAPDLINIGMVCDAIWSDFDNDQSTDLILVGEWMAPVFLKNHEGKFANVTAATGLLSSSGSWNSIAGGDFNNDGFTD